MNEEVTQEILQVWKKAVDDYKIYHDIRNPDHISASVTEVKKMIRHVSIYDNRWRGFPIDTFKTTGLKAEQALYKYIR